LGASFSNIATAVAGATYSDTTNDAFTTYQYPVVKRDSEGRKREAAMALRLRQHLPAILSPKSPLK
jgi:hypothetical protein